MLNFRDIHPRRRNNPPRYSRYQRYKPLLKEDFHDKCGYCDDGDSWAGGKRVFHIDHFVPKVQLRTIRETDYFNLVYSCYYCNRSKWGDWPSQDEMIHNNGSIGYVDPCHEDYCLQFKRNALGEIEYCTTLGQYMYENLNLSLRRHAVIWNLHRLDEQIKELKKLKSRGHFNSKNEKEFSELLAAYWKYSSYLRKANNE